MDRIVFVVGHFGSGKTEFALNYALFRAKKDQSVVLIDMDIANPYFRSYDVKDELQQQGLEVINGGFLHQADLPSLTPEAYRVFTDHSYVGVFDIGGNDNGARVLGYYSEEVQEAKPEVWCVINPMRPETRSVALARKMLKEIKAAARTNITGLVLNAHLFDDTKKEDLLSAYETFRVMEETDGIPIRYVMVKEGMDLSLDPIPKNLLFPIRIFMKKPWETER